MYTALERNGRGRGADLINQIDFYTLAYKAVRYDEIQDREFIAYAIMRSYPKCTHAPMGDETDVECLWRGKL